MEIKPDHEKTTAELEQEKIANLQLILTLNKRALKISEISLANRKLIDAELVSIAAIECKPDLTKLLKSKENAIHYERIGKLSHEFLKQILPDK